MGTNIQQASISIEALHEVSRKFGEPCDKRRFNPINKFHEFSHLGADNSSFALWLEIATDCRYARAKYARYNFDPTSLKWGHGYQSLRGRYLR